MTMTQKPKTSFRKIQIQKYQIGRDRLGSGDRTDLFPANGKSIFAKRTEKRQRNASAYLFGVKSRDV